MEQLIDKIAKAPWGTKIGIVVLIAAVTTGLNWYLFTDDLEMQIERTEEQRKKLEGDFIDKQQIADNLNEYRRQKELLEQKLEAALQELPQDKAIDELLRQMNDVGVKAGLEITAVEPQPESKEQFFARIPVKMKVAGNYHEVAVFFDSVGKLKRIVNVTDIKFAQPTKRNEKMVLAAEFQATTFRFLKPEEMAPPAKPKGAK
ncbi:type 4a pilus biogenesis protein PilO [Vulgatibacter sp.]|uniref:type 4a pilus biogenesis protein PilO n=1 Tax=Vulgatibacter sp. TaxID=1971226 RepID=UPI003562A76A